VTQLVIELGEYRIEAAPADGSVLVWNPEARRDLMTDPAWLAHRRTVLRRLAAASLALICLLSLSASVYADPSMGPPLWTTTVTTGFSISADTVYFTEGAGHALMARHLETGERRWISVLPEPATSTMDIGHGVVAAFTHARAPTGRGTASGLILVSAATGDVLLARSGVRAQITGADRLAMFLSGEISRDCAAAPSVCVELTAFDLESRREVWRTPISADSALVAQVGPADRGRMIAVRELSGDVVVRDAETGVVTETVRRVDTSTEPMGGGAVLTGDTLVTAVREEGQATITAYRFDPVRDLWSTTLPVGPITQYTSQFALVPCAQMLCLRVDGGHHLIDPVSGTLGPHLRFDVVAQLGDGDLLAVPQNRPGQSAASRRIVYRLKPTTGLAAATFPNATIVDWPDGRGRALLMREGTAGTVFTIVDRDGSSDAFGRIEGTGLHCEAKRTILVCSEPGGQLRAWRLPS
jgi:hypothetical protein